MGSEIRAYNFDDSVAGHPRTMTSQSGLAQMLTDEWTRRVNSWRMPGPRSLERSSQEGGIEAVAALVASLTLPTQIEDHEGAIDQHRDELDNT